MPKNIESLLAGRNAAPLSQREIDRAISTFLSLDPLSRVRHEARARTVFRVEVTEQGETSEIVFGPIFTLVKELSALTHFLV
jgi:hypothetical protein